MTQYYSRKDYEYAGDSNFTIPFSYIDKDDINVYVNEDKITAWTWLNDSQINISSTLTTGDIVSIRRNTPIDEKIVTYQNMSMVLNDDNLNLSQDQILDAVQEMYDNNVTFEIKVEGDIDTIEETANTALSNSQTAITTANSADSKADTAVSTANTASSNASTALSNSQTALNNSQSAVNTANSASETATTASNKVDAFGEDIASVISAAEKINELEEAVTTATNAATTASNKADVATNKATEAVNAANRAEAAIPSQTGQNGKFLKTNGTSTSWETVDLSTKQDVLVSGTNIKTINSSSILGSGDIELQVPLISGTNIKTLNGATLLGSGNLNTPFRNIGEIVTSRVPLVDAGLHLLDGSLIDGSGSYSAFVTYIAGLVTDYPDLFDTEANWQAAVTANGFCDKFVYNSENNTVRLPLFRNKLVEKLNFDNGTKNVSVFGNGKALGITNGSVTRYLGGASGAAYLSTNTSSALNTSTPSPSATSGNFGVSTSSSYSGLKGTVSISNSVSELDIYYYIVVATTTKTNIQVDIDEIATDLNVKADVDGTNMVSSVKNFDGQWVYSHKTIANGITAPTSNTTYSLSTYLPNDSYIYEVLFNGLAASGNTTGKYNQLSISTDTGGGSYICEAITRTSGTNIAVGATILTVGSLRQVTIQGIAGNSGTTTLSIEGYRRVGTNS